MRMAEADLAKLLASLEPYLDSADYVFCSLPEANAGVPALATMLEPEGLSIITIRQNADAAGLRYSGVFRMIMLQVHSSLQAVGLTAAVATCLAQAGISANVVAAFHHDYVFVPAAEAERALESLQALSQNALLSS